MKTNPDNRYQLEILVDHSERKRLSPVLTEQEAKYWTKRTEKLGGKVEIVNA